MKKKAAAPPTKKSSTAKTAEKPKKTGPPTAQKSSGGSKASSAKPASKPAKAPEKKTPKATALKPTKTAPAKSADKKPAKKAAPAKSQAPTKTDAKKKDAVSKASTPTKPAPPAKESPKKKTAEKSAAPAGKEATKALKKNQAAGAAGSDKPEAAVSTVKTRSHHLMKILALREARKVKKPEDLHGAGPTAIVKGKPAAAAAPEPPKKKKRVIRKAPYNKSDLKDLRKLLSDERERLLSDLRSLDDLADSNKETTHATFSSHQADAASDSASLESTFIQRRMEEERFAWVTEALVKLDKGTYGLCDLCADEPAGLCTTCPFIPIDRLRAKPHAKMCVPIRMQMEKRGKR